LPAQLIDEVIAECGRQEQRVRVLPARIALYFTLALWFCPGQGYPEVLRVLFRQFRPHLRTGRWRIPTVSAAVKARHRLGREPLKALFRRLRGSHADPSEPGMSAFGLELALLKVSVDGTSLDVADTTANRAAFGAPPRNGKGAAGPFPKIRLLTLIACGTRTIVDAVWGPFATGELTLLGKLVGLGALRPGMLVLADRYLSGHPQVTQVIAAGAELVFRAQNNRRLPVLTELPDGSYLSVRSGLRRPVRRYHRRVQEPKNGRLTAVQQQLNKAHNSLRAIGERGKSLLKMTFKALRNVSLNPWRIGKIVAAALVILHIDHDRTT
jgi:hypothetical protein